MSVTFFSCAMLFISAELAVPYDIENSLCTVLIIRQLWFMYNVQHAHYSWRGVYYRHSLTWILCVQIREYRHFCVSSQAFSFFFFAYTYIFLCSFHRWWYYMRFSIVSFFLSWTCFAWKYSRIWSPIICDFWLWFWWIIVGSDHSLYYLIRKLIYLLHRFDLYICIYDEIRYYIYWQCRLRPHFLYSLNCFYLCKITIPSW